MGLRSGFDAFRGWVSFAAATLLMVAAGRFAAGVVMDAAGDNFQFLRTLQGEDEDAEPTLRLRPIDSLSALDGGVAESEIPPELRKLMDGINNDPTGATTGKDKKKKKKGRSTATLIVSVGPQRSEVFVNGVPVGRTPYVGDLQCAKGKKVRVDILAPKGTPLRRDVECRSGTITIDY